MPYVHKRSGQFFTRLRRKPRLSVLRSSLLRRMDEAVEECVRVSSEALAKEDTLPAFAACQLLRRSRLGGFRRRHKRDHGCEAVGLHVAPLCLSNRPGMTIELYVHSARQESLSVALR
jgi:hypothetical protein